MIFPGNGSPVSGSRMGRADALKSPLRIALDGTIALPLLAPEEEQLLAILVERAGNVDRTAECEPPRVVLVRRLRETVARVRPGIGIECIVLVTPEHVATEALRSALGHHPQLTCRRPPILCLV